MIVQIKPDSDNISKCFHGCLMTVTEVKPWGYIGYFTCPTEKDEAPGLVYFRVDKEDCVVVGESAFVLEEEDEIFT